MRIWLLTLLVLSLLGAASSCSTSTGFVNYNDLGVYSSDNAGNRKFTDIGPISSEQSSFVWASCDKVATSVVKEMLDIAKTRGGNTVYKITFESRNGRVTTPTCITRWGWFAAYIVGGLGPWMVASSAEGISAKISSDTPVTDAIQINTDSDTSQLAAEYIAKLGFKNEEN